MNLDHLNLQVNDPAACRAFYEEWFDFTHAFDADGGHFLRNPAGFLLALVPADPHVPLPVGVHVGFSFPSPDEVDARRGAMSAAGVPVSALQDFRPDDDYVSFRCWDPDGTEIEQFWES